MGRTSLPPSPSDLIERPSDTALKQWAGRCPLTRQESHAKTHVISGLSDGLQAPSYKQLRAQSRTAASVSLHFTLHELFEKQAARHPGAKALTWDGGEMSYHELDAMGNQLARFLHDRGVGPRARIAIVLPRSPSFLVANLAVLKAGGSCVPIAPPMSGHKNSNHLEERSEEKWRRTLARVGLDCVITLEKHSELFERSAPICIVLDVDSQQINRCSDEKLCSPVTPCALAYIVDAHRSEQLNVAVELSHTNLARLFYAVTATYLRPHPRDGWSWTHDIGDDRALWDIWGALLHGGVLVIMPTPNPFCPEALSRSSVAHRINILSLQGAHLMRLVESGLCGPGAHRTLREVIVSDSVVEPTTLARWLEHVGSNGPRLSAAWGTPETSVYATIRPVTRADVNFSAMRIGAPLPDLHYLIVAEDLTPAPIGEEGELLIGGPGLARGYLGDPSLTSARFVPNTVSRVPGDCLFRTNTRVCPVNTETPIWIVSETGCPGAESSTFVEGEAGTLDSATTDRLLARHHNGIACQTNKLRIT